MTEPSPLIATAFRKVSRADWSDGAPLAIASELVAAFCGAWPVRPPDGLPDAPPALTARAQAAAADERGPRIHAMRQAGMPWKDIRLAVGYESLSGATNRYQRWCAATNTPPVPDRAARVARMADAVLGVLL